MAGSTTKCEVMLNAGQNTPTLSRNFFWYAKRLRVMGPSEVIHRVAEQCTLKMLDVQHRFGGINHDAITEEVDRFSFCSGSVRKLPDLPWSFSINDETVERMLSGKLSVLGHEWTWRPDNSVWHEAPDTHREWPRRFFGSIPYREGNPYGDVRVSWEPSRLQHLVFLGLLAQESGLEIRRRAVGLLEAQLLSWFRANPALTGIHYISVMECGLRILAVCHAIDLVRDWLQDTKQVWKSLLGLIGNHAKLIQKRLSVHSSAGNHTIAEAAALVYSGSLFPEMPEAQLWRSLGLSLLEHEARHQVLQDGGGAEQTFWYHCFISDLYGLVVLLLLHQHYPVPVAIEQAFNRSLSFLHAFGRNADSRPFIGDGDGGYALSPFLNFSSWRKTSRTGLVSFADSGYSIIRDPLIRHQLTFDHGPLGLAPCYAHGHADALSVVLKMDEQDVLLDPGTYTYTGDRAWRNYFRGTRAHNTVAVDELDQAVQETAFMWSHPFHSHVVFQDETPDGAVTILAFHDGYRKRVGVTHWRAVLFDPPNTWLIWDRLTGQGVHRLELNWHLGIEPHVGADRYVFPCDGGSLCLAVEGGASAVHRGETAPISGWRSRQYGIKEPIPTIRTAFTGALPHEFLTRIWMGAGQAPPEPSSDRLLELRRLTHENETH